VSHNLIHQRYSSKEAAWFAAVDHGFQRLSAELKKTALRYDGGPGPGILRAVVQRFAALTMARPALARIIYQEAARPGPRFQYMFENYIGPIHETAVAFIEQMQESGEFRSGPLTTAYFFATTWGIGGMASSAEVLAKLAGPGVDPSGVADLAVDMLMDGLIGRVPSPVL
jgi:AcrR family transcriptional regulator